MGCPEHNNMDVSEFSFHLNLIILGVGWLASLEKIDCHGDILFWEEFLIKTRPLTF
jgi:hypothetical protein